MKMVKTSMKTQHQHVMPPRKGKKGKKGKGKEKVQSKSTSLITGQSDGDPGRPQLQNTPEDKVGDVKTAFRTQHDTTPHLWVSL